MISPHPKIESSKHPHRTPVQPANRRQHQSVRQKKRIDNLAVDGCYCPLCMR